MMHPFAGSDLILINGNFRTLDRGNPMANAAAIRDGRFVDVGDVEQAMRHWGTRTRVIDLNGDTVIPGLNVSLAPAPISAGGYQINSSRHFMCELNRFGVTRTVDAASDLGPPDIKIRADKEADALPVDRYNPWHTLYWLVSGRAAGSGLLRNDITNQLPRELVLQLCTMGGRFPHEGGKKGCIRAGQLADLAVLSADYFAIPEEEIMSLESLLTVVAGEIVYTGRPYAEHGPVLERTGQVLI